MANEQDPTATEGYYLAHHALMYDPPQALRYWAERYLKTAYKNGHKPPEAIYPKTGCCGQRKTYWFEEKTDD